MFKILLIEDDKTLFEKMIFILESVSGVSVSAASTFAKAQDILNQNPDIQLIVADYRSATTPLVEAFKRSAALIDCILCVDVENDPIASNGWKILEKIERKHLAIRLKQRVEQFCREQNENTEKLKFCRIKTSLLLETSPLDADIYAKLSETKYLKIFLQGDVFDADDFKKYTEDRKIEYMYLREDSCQIFIHKYLSQIDQVIQRSPPPSHEELSSMNIAAYESVQELTNVLGFTKEVQQLAKSHVQMTVQFMDKKPNLAKLLSRMKSQGKYQADHSYLVSYIACAIATQLQWGSESTFFKLSLAAFLHDLAINDDKIAACSTLAEAKALPGMDEKGLAAFKNHPNAAAELVRKMQEIPPDVDGIIQQHHELPDGKGFPRGIAANYISPLSTVFIISHDIVKNILFPPSEGFDLPTYLANAQEKFQHSNFKRILVAAKKLELSE